MCVESSGEYGMYGTFGQRRWSMWGCASKQKRVCGV